MHMETIKPNKYHLILALAFLSICLPLAIIPLNYTFDTFDERYFHYPEIEKFADDFPNVDLVNYKLTMTPLYHLTMALLMKIFGMNLIGLRIIHVFISLICVLVIFQYLSKQLNTNRALLIIACLVFSPYFLGPSIKLSTDNAVLLLSILAIMLLDRKEPVPVKRHLLASIFITLSLLTRQIYAWLTALGWFSLFYRRSEDHFKTRLGTGLLYLIPLVCLVPFFFMWRGLTTPYFQQMYQRDTLVNLDVFVYVISLFGLLGSFFFFWYFQYFRENMQKKWPLILILLFSIAFLLIHPILDASELKTGGGALWNLASRLPSLFSTSIAFWILFPAGLFYLYAVLMNRKQDRDYFMLVVLLLWLLANMLSGQAFHRYYEPFLIFFIGYTLKGMRSEPRFYWLGPILLILIYIGVDIVRFLA